MEVLARLLPKVLEHAAALKDALALLELAPEAPWHAGSPVAGSCMKLAQLANEMLRLLRLDVVRSLGRDRNLVYARIISPYAGGLPSGYLAQLAQGRDGGGSGYAVKALRIGTLNQGRTGFIAVGTQMILDWRIRLSQTR